MIHTDPAAGSSRPPMLRARPARPVGPPKPRFCRVDGRLDGATCLPGAAKANKPRPPPLPLRQRRAAKLPQLGRCRASRRLPSQWSYPAVGPPPGTSEEPPRRGGAPPPLGGACPEASCRRPRAGKTLLSRAPASQRPLTPRPLHARPPRVRPSPANQIRISSTASRPIIARGCPLRPFGSSALRLFGPSAFGTWTFAVPRRAKAWFSLV